MSSIIDYDLMIEELKQDIVRKSLKYVTNDQIPGNHHFYISFITSDPNLIISKRLLDRYPKEITIVLQHQFRNLIVKDDYFKVTLHFDGIEEQIQVPYKAILSFSDPSMKFFLHFKQRKSQTTQIKKETQSPKEKDLDNVVSLDQFRRK